ncbi:MAG TPA: hypothetical protein VGC55_03195 [Dokdonella sp.]
MKKFALAAMAGTLVLTACSHREPSDVQLGALLRTDRAELADPAPPFDTALLTCLRAWSGDVALLTGLPVGVASEEGKKMCRTKVDARVADPSHNPEKFTFDEISTPNVVKRAMALAAARRIAAVNAASTRPPPGAFGKPPKTPLPPRPAEQPPLGPPVELGAAGVTLSESEHMCEQLQQKAATTDNLALKNYGDSCASSLKRTRDAMEAAAARGDSAKIEGYAKTLTRYAAVARGMLDKEEKK